MKITKLDAAGMQLDAAIDHFLRGELVPAIHCAGAAEELYTRELQKRGGKSMPDRYWDDTQNFAGFSSSKKQFIAEVNQYRDWVKHTNDGHSDVFELEDWHAFFQIGRAVDSYRALVGDDVVGARKSIVRYGKWIVDNAAYVKRIADALPD